MNQQTSPENSISEELSEVLSRLTTNQIRFVVARQEAQTDREAAESIDLRPDTVYRWPDDVKLAVQLMARDGLTTATHIRRRHLAKAMLVKIGGLDSDDESVRQKVASEIIEWELGKAAQRQELSGPAGGPIGVVRFVTVEGPDEGPEDGE